MSWWSHSEENYYIFKKDGKETFKLWRNLDKHWLIYSDKRPCISQIIAKPSLFTITIEANCKGEKPYGCQQCVKAVICLVPFTNMNRVAVDKMSQNLERTKHTKLFLRNMAVHIEENINIKHRNWFTRIKNLRCWEILIGKKCQNSLSILHI